MNFNQNNIKKNKIKLLFFYQKKYILFEIRQFKL